MIIADLNNLNVLRKNKHYGLAPETEFHFEKSDKCLKLIL